ncbi:MAG: alpha-galactosidase [Clostridia bacterium]|nr:alpha-galactosidase [Clostridia bacterium]
MEKQHINCDYTLTDGLLSIHAPLISHNFADIATAQGCLVTPQSRALPYYEVTATRTNGSYVTYRLWENLPVIRVGDDSEETLLTLAGEHWTVRAVRLNAFTDDFDTLTEEIEFNLFFKGIRKQVEGDIFFFEDTLTNNAFLLISETPDHTRGRIWADRNEEKTAYHVHLKNGGYPVTLGICKAGECEALCRNYLRHVNHCPELIAMSNTWGDYHGSKRVCESFVLDELTSATEMGIDVLQIDDGWQAGNTIYEIQRDERGHQVFYEHYWDLNTQRFPNGISPITAKATKKGLRVGLWFAPSSHDCFAKIERDKLVLKKLYQEWGVRFFKLDMYQATDKAHSDKMRELLDFIYSLGNDVSVQMDVTRYERLNYLCGAEYGTIFVENRYTRTANYFPHRALRNLWDISRYVPSNRFQFELINPDLNTESYHDGDPLAPQFYSMDYLFASVMLSNPLFWMELQYLSEERRRQLEPMMAVWKQHRESLANADVAPIGEKPCGRSHTGFLVSQNGTPSYLLLFREMTDRSIGKFELPVSNMQAELLYSNGDVTLSVDGDTLTATYAQPRTYAFIKLTK